MVPTETFAPAKINLALHVTGHRADGFHLIDSLVAFADLGDRVSVCRSKDMALRVCGPMAAGVPGDAGNLCWSAAQAYGEPVAITLEKHLPASAGIGGGSSDAAAVLRAMEHIFGREFAGDALTLGADVPACRRARAARMTGIGEVLTPVTLPKLNAILVNPGVAVSTPAVFRALSNKSNHPMGAVPECGAEELIAWLREMRNDLQAPAIDLQPVIGSVLAEIFQGGAELARMSGSGATCFGLFSTREMAQQAAEALKKSNPKWWIAAVTLE